MPAYSRPALNEQETQNLFTITIYSMTEVEEFEAFLEPTFAAVPFASALLQATNVVEDAELDVQTALKKLHFDAAECDKRIEALTSTHHGELLQNLFSGERVNSDLEHVIMPSNKRLQSTYKRIDDEVVQPYEAAVRMNSAFSRVHQTLQLLRGCSFFGLFVQQLNEQIEMHGKNSEPEGDVVVKMARLYKKLLSFYPADNTELSNQPESKSSGEKKEIEPGNGIHGSNGIDGIDARNGHDSEEGGFVEVLRPVRLVQDYRPQLIQKLSLFCNQLSTSISHDLGHHNSFVGSNKSLQCNLAAFQLLHPTDFLSFMESAAIAKSIQVSLTSLTRALQSPRILVSTFKDVAQASSTFLSKMSEVLAVHELSDHSPRSLLDILEQSLGSSLEDVFYERLAQKFKKSLAVTLARGGPIARNLRAQYEAISEAVGSTLEGPARAHFQDSIRVIES